VDSTSAEAYGNGSQYVEECQSDVRIIWFMVAHAYALSSSIPLFAISSTDPYGVSYN